jgi:hypothetical protein
VYLGGASAALPASVSANKHPYSSMELFLNLLWLLLAVPAMWVWRKATCRQAHSTGQSRQCVLILACLLMMLFPVISASDDLQAMRPEVEESATRDGLRSSSHGKLSALLGICGNYALSAAGVFVSPERSVRGQVVPLAVLLPGAELVPTRAGRGPPTTLMG